MDVSHKQKTTVLTPSADGGISTSRASCCAHTLARSCGGAVQVGLRIAAVETASNRIGRTIACQSERGAVGAYIFACRSASECREIDVSTAESWHKSWRKKGSPAVGNPPDRLQSRPVRQVDVLARRKRPPRQVSALLVAVALQLAAPSSAHMTQSRGVATIEDGDQLGAASTVDAAAYSNRRRSPEVMLTWQRRQRR